MERKVLAQLIDWKNNKRRKPLVVEGARQVGKTWAVKEFGKRHYQHLAYINFEEAKHLQGLFVQDYDTDRIMRAIRTQCGVPCEAGKTLIPIKGVANEDKEIKEDVPYLIMPQYNAMAALTADKKNVSIEQVALQEEMTTPQDGVEPVISVDAAQTWMFEKAGNNLYYIVNGNGEILTSTSGYALTTQTKKSSGQLFKVESIDGVFVKITNSSNSKSLDLSNAAYKPGTQVGLWDYGSNITEAHRNWYLCKLDTFDENALGIENNLLYPKATSYTLYNINGMRAKATAPGIYILRGADGTSKKIIKR